MKLLISIAIIKYKFYGSKQIYTFETNFSETLFNTNEPGGSAN
jgi:hypothetical protein